MAHNKPTRRDLLIVIGRVQNAIGEARGLHEDAKDPSGFSKTQQLLANAHDLCIAARSFDAPLDGATSRNGWGRNGDGNTDARRSF